ncbi:enterochelin esterase [Pseudoruegeria sp. HB172150]|uniref:enterochelin esterase n=1 Tax=Pseudoruegeria sp. HB172150 TaxID=2721164 RepID=UPI001C12FD8E|nr:enterochelin esterase [Pseudoruegeria sp. HB172150]
MTGRVLAAVAAVMWIASAGPGAPGPGDRRTTAVEAGGSASFPLSAESGDYIVGRLESPNHPFDLVLVDADGADVRRLLEGNTGAGQFHFVVPGSGMALEARNGGKSGFEVVLEIERQVPLAAQTGMPETFLSPKIADLAERIAGGGDTGAFWEERAAEGTPMIEPAEREGHVIATFLWRGATQNVRLWGGPAADHTWMERLGDSDVWYASFVVPDSARLTYGFAPDVPQFDGTERENRVALLATLQADPLNLSPVYLDAPDRWAQRSQMVLAKAPEQPGMDGPLPEARGTVEPIAYTSQRLGNIRTVDIYTPAGFDPAATDTVLLFLFDGPAYQTDRAPVPEILDRLIADGSLPPVVAVLIDPMDNRLRGAELPCNPDFADAMAEELLPLVEVRLGLTADPARTVVSGSSYGGLASAWIVHRRPESFGSGIVLSGSFWWAPDGYDRQGTPYMSSLWMKDAPEDVRLWLSAGIYETGRAPGEVSILETSRHLRDVMRMRSVDVTYREYVGGHDYLVWRGALAEALLGLFGSS